MQNRKRNHLGQSFFRKQFFKVQSFSIVSTALLALSLGITSELIVVAPNVALGAVSKTSRLNLATHFKVGEEKDVKGLKVQPLQVVEDSRCPQGAVCFVPGMIVIKVKLTSGADITEIYLGNTQGKSILLDADFRTQKDYKFGPASYNGYSLLFNGANARSTTTDKLDQNEYDLSISVVKSQSRIGH